MTGPDQIDLHTGCGCCRGVHDEPIQWPYGPPEFHEDCCRLHRHDGVGFCDCKASDASDVEWGLS